MYEKQRAAYLIERGQTITYIYFSSVLHVFQIFCCFVIFRLRFYIYFVTLVYAVIVLYLTPAPFKFQIVTFLALRVIICKTLKKKGCAFRNIGYFTNIVVSVPWIIFLLFSSVLLFYSWLDPFNTGSSLFRYGTLCKYSYLFTFLVRRLWTVSYFL